MVLVVVLVLEEVVGKPLLLPVLKKTPPGPPKPPPGPPKTPLEQLEMSRIRNELSVTSKRKE